MKKIKRISLIIITGSIAFMCAMILLVGAFFIVYPGLTSMSHKQRPIIENSTSQDVDSISLQASTQQEYQAVQNHDTLQSTSETQPDEEQDQNYGEIRVYSLKGWLLRKIKYPSPNNWDRYINYINGYPTDTIITGDFDGDGIKEQAWFKQSEGAYDSCWESKSEKACKGIMVFSNKKIKPLYVDYCPMACFINEGDLNGDKKDEIGVLPGWFSSTCRNYYVYTYREGTWKLICEPINSSMNMRGAGIDIIQKHPVDSGYVIIRESTSFIESKFPEIPFHDDRVGPYSCQDSPIIEYKWKLKS